MRRWPDEKRSRWLAGLSAEETLALQTDWTFWARASQLPPAERYLCWLVLAGRGWGKTRTGAQWTIDYVRHGRVGGGVFALVGRTVDDAVKIMVEGESGILAYAPPDFYPKWRSAEAELTWPNGVKSPVFGATNPNAFRGYNHGGFWADEICAWQHWSCFAQLLLGCRVGKNPQGVVTTTPRPIPELRELIKKRTTVTTTGSTYANLANLAHTFATEILSQYQGTRLGRQELEAEILDDNPDAMFPRALVEAHRVNEHPRLLRIVVGVDPAGSNSVKSNNTGIIVAGVGVDRKYYVLEDGTMAGKPEAWAAQVSTLYRKWKADRVIAEVNMGGDMVESVVKAWDPKLAYKGVHASRGKLTRAEPISALYERGLVKHVGYMPKLEDEMCTYDPLAIDGMKSDSRSPDRLDALVWALTELHDAPKPPKSMNFDKSPMRKNPYEGI